MHVSGHASAGELVYCYNIVKPRNVMPVHGEWRHLRANADLAIRTGVASPTGSSSPRTASSSIWSTGVRPSPARFLPATSTWTAWRSAAPQASLRDRLTLAAEGVVTVVAIVDADTGALAEAPDFLARGFVHDDATFEPVIPRHREDPGHRGRGRRRGRAPTRTTPRPRRGELGVPHPPPQAPHHPCDHRRLSHSPATRSPFRRRRPEAAPVPELRHRLAVPSFMGSG
ncbi:hypothetical protein LT493_24580 [Streptomyces tricolor]|nr:hypothetical protein [Streptomyces tricolor]